MIENTTALTRAIVEALVLLEDSSVDEIDPDLAIRGMENITAHLVELSEPDQRALREELAGIASSSSSDSYAAFVSTLADSIGLAE